MRNPLSEKIVNIAPSGIRRFFDLVSEMDDAISLGVGEPDFDTPWRIREEGIYSLERGRTFYTSNAGLKELKQEICRYLSRKINVEYDFRNEVVVTVGGSEGIDIAARRWRTRVTKYLFRSRVMFHASSMYSTCGFVFSHSRCRGNEFKLQARVGKCSDRKDKNTCAAISK